MRPSRCCGAGRIAWRPEEPCRTCCATRVCWKNPPANVTTCWRSIRTAPRLRAAPSLYWNWAGLIALSSTCRLVPQVTFQRELLQACIEKQPASRIAPLVAHYDGINTAVADSEAKYFEAGWDAFCGQKEAALRMIRHAVEQHYCAYPAMDTDPLLPGILDAFPSRPTRLPAAASPGECLP